MSNEIFIRKEAGKKKDAIRVNSEADIPAELKDTIKIVDGQLELDCTEGIEHAPLGSVIGYEVSANTKSGMNAWNIANYKDSLVEKDGVFYTKAAINRAQKIGDELPAFMEGADVVKNEDGSYTVTTDWGQSTGYPEEAYFVCYGQKPDGKPDVNILTKTEPSYDAYYVCDQDGNVIEKLSEMDPVSKEEEMAVMLEEEEAKSEETGYQL